MKVLFHKYKDILFLLLLSILVPLLWYGLGSNMMIASNDVGSSIDPVVLFKKRIFAWDSSINLGTSQTSYAGSIIYYGSEALAAYITGSVFTGQKIVVILWFFLTMLVMYICLQKLPVFKNKPYMALLASILFQFNHFQQHGWRVFWRTRFATYILLPLLLMLLIDYLEGRRSLLRTAVFTGLSVLLLNGGGSPPVFGAVILLVLVTIIYYLFINLHGNFLLYLKRSVLFILVSGVVSLVISSFWFLPYVYFTLNTYSQALESLGGVASQLAWVDQISANAGILNLFRNVGLPFWDPSFGVPHLFFANPMLIVISFVFPILTLSSLFFVKNKEERKYITLFLSLTIIALLFTAGTHKPFREFYIFLLNHIPGYVIFRSSLYKFGNLLWFSYAVLIAFSVSSIIVKIKDIPVVKKRLTKTTAIILPAFFISFIFLWDFPIFNSKFFIWNPPLTIMEKIPQYVIDFKDWINKRDDLYGRILLLPDSSKTWRSEVYRWNYMSFGSQLLPLALNKNTVSNDATTDVFVRLSLDELYGLMKKNNPLWLDIAKELNIRYLLLRKDYFYDLDWISNTQPYVYEEILADNDKVEKIKTFGEWDFYRIKTDIPANKIYAESEPIFYSSKDDNLLQLFSFVKELRGESIDNVVFIPSSSIVDGRKQNSLIIIPESIVPVSKEQEAVLSGMIKPYDDPDIVFLTPDYKWKVPRSGMYKIYLHSTSLLVNSKTIEINIGDRRVEGKITTSPNNKSWQYFGSVELREGEWGLQIFADGINMSSIRQGDLVFIKESTGSEQELPPIIEYRRINPTKYTAKISAGSPFFLILDEKFDPAWRIYMRSAENVPHMKVNGYTNGWYIDPANLQQTDFEVVIEYWPQRIFYLSFIITILITTGSVIYLFKSRPRHSRYS